MSVRCVMKKFLKRLGIIFAVFFGIMVVLATIIETPEQETKKEVEQTDEQKTEQAPQQATNQKTKQETGPKAEAKANNGPKAKPVVSKPISEHAFTEYDKENYPKVYQKWGSDWIERLEAHERAAADKIANSDNACDSISFIALSDAKSIPKQEIVVFVDCANGERFFVSDKDLNKELKSQSEQAISDKVALSECREMVKRDAKYPDSVDFKLLDTSVQKSKTHGNIIVTTKFTAKNDFGAELPYTAKCLFTPDGKVEFEYIK